MAKTHTAASQLPGPASQEAAVLYQHRDVVAVPRAHFNSLAWYYPLAHLPLFVLQQVNTLLILLPFSMYKTGGKITCFVLRNTGRIKSLLFVQRANQLKVQLNFTPPMLIEFLPLTSVRSSFL